MPSVVIITPWNTGGGRNEMLAISAFPAEWTEKNGQAGADISLGRDRCLAFGKVSAPQLAALQADSRFAVLWSGESDDMPDLSAEAVQDAGALRGVIDNTHHADVARLATVDAETLADTIDVILTVNLYPPWQAGLSVAVDDVFYYEGNLYQVVQSHMTQVDWTPDVVFALFKRYYEIGAPPEPWVQPLGSHDSYRDGQQVTHGGFTWESNQDANVWEPGVFGWTNLTPPPATPEWSGAGVAYKVNDLVTYNGSTYRCLQAHNSQPGWTPVAVPALWALVP